MWFSIYGHKKTLNSKISSIKNEKECEENQRKEKQKTRGKK